MCRIEIAYANITVLPIFNFWKSLTLIKDSSPFVYIIYTLIFLRNFYLKLISQSEINLSGKFLWEEQITFGKLMTNILISGNAVKGAAAQF